MDSKGLKQLKAGEARLDKFYKGTWKNRTQCIDCNLVIEKGLIRRCRVCIESRGNGQ